MHGLSGLALVLSVVAAAIGIAGTAGAVYAAFTVSKNKALLELYREEAAAQKQRGDRLDTDNVELKARVAACEAAQRILSEQVSGAQAIASLRTELHEQHIELMAVMTSLLTTLAEGFTPRRSGQ